MIRIDAAWIAVEPLDMRSGLDTALARVVNVFGAAHSHHAYLFLNRRSNRLKVLVHDGFGLWLRVGCRRDTSSDRTLILDRVSSSPASSCALWWLDFPGKDWPRAHASASFRL